MVAGSKLIAFVATTRPDDAIHFYSEVLGLALLEDTPFALVFDANGTQLRVQKVDSVLVQPYTSLGWEVADVAAVSKRLSAHGISLEKFEGLDQDASGVWTAPDGTAVAWFRDPDGNLLSLTQQR